MQFLEKEVNHDNSRFNANRTRKSKGHIGTYLSELCNQNEAKPVFIQGNGGEIVPSSKETLSIKFKEETKPIIFLDCNSFVVAVFLKKADAAEFQSISKFRYRAVNFNIKNDDAAVMPKLGDVYIQ